MSMSYKLINSFVTFEAMNILVSEGSHVRFVRQLCNKRALSMSGDEHFTRIRYINQIKQISRTEGMPNKKRDEI